jgi:ribonuclease HI
MTGSAGRYLIQVDGSSKCNPGPAGIGVRILNPDGSVLREISHSIGVRTNNQAEYEALLCALRECRLLKNAPVTIRTDSELLFYQMNGRYRVRHPGIKPLHAQAEELIARLPHVKIELVRREQNHETDKLAKAAADAGSEATTNGQTG